MSIIFRVQNAEGKGPYSLGGESWDILEKHNDPDVPDGRKTHPAPCDDPGILRWMEKSEYCGFESLEALVEWFSGEELALLEILGFTIVPVRGRITSMGQKQLLFTKHVDKQAAA